MAMNSPNIEADWLVVGRVVGAQGLNGEVRIYPDSDFPQRFTEPGERWLLSAGATQPTAVQLVSGRYMSNKGLYVVKFAGISNRDQAEALRDSELLVPESDRPPLEDDEFHVPDLLGLEVFDQATQTLVGTVTNVVPAGNDLLEVTLAGEPAKTVLIPFVMAIVPVVDLAQRRIEITPPVGLIEERRDGE
ncbi:MAG: ribosome maturation factor RimM [Leptolyngbyaceae cyanobacterium SL_7_1]|nr:ribosome maturation factor RimM [Leptolyngbyaceae cyanobacterium SL_7_1]